MAQTLVALYVHIIFSTKDRRDLIDPLLETGLYAYIGGIVGGNKSKLLAANGTENHTHLLVSLGKTIDLSELVGDIKRDSSKWMKTSGSRLFQWQDGYGGFSVSPSHLGDVKKYIANQKAHHARENYQDEFRGFLRRYEINYDEDYVWG